MKNFKIKQITLILFTSALLFGCSIPKTEELSRPNILFIIADDASRDSMGIYGSEYIKTPNFDRIGKEGVVFKNAYVCNPKCSPARACLLTGRYSWQLEEATNHRPFLSDKWKFYPDMLEASGYTIGLTGKGWGPGEHNHPRNPAGPNFKKIRCTPPYSGINTNDYSANFTAFLETTKSNKPFCFWLGAREPHREYEKDSWKKAKIDTSKVTVPAYYPDNPTIVGDLADYALEVEWLDQQIGKCLKILEDKGLLDNTIIIATSDHGMPFPRVKGQIYDDGFHTPFVVRWGKGIKPGRVVDDFISFPDLAPTLLEVAGIPKHPQMTGKSFLDILKSDMSGTVDPTRDHTLLGKERHDIGRTDGELLSVSYPSRAIRNEQFLYIRNFKPHRWPAGDPEYGYKNCDNSPTKEYLVELDKSDPDYKYYEMAFSFRPPEELYDMNSDPDCVKNLASNSEFDKTKQRLWTQLEAELIKQEDPRVLGKGNIFDYYPYNHIEKTKKTYGDKYYDPITAFEAYKATL
ncbi:MAG: N-sulfoglucosamine sulfohydrolase [Saprospiraceae bacterium]|jgi:N-sulfoglucosamine sulfohydrolase